MATNAEVIDQARKVLNDTDAVNGYRYSEDDLLVYLRDAVQLAFTLRPDIFIGTYNTPLPPAYTPAEPFPLPYQFFAATGNYMAGRAELRDDEYAVDSRAALFIGSLSSALVKGA